MTIVEFLRARYDEEWARLDELDDLQSFPDAVYWTSRRHTDPGVGPSLAVQVVAGPKAFVRLHPDLPGSTPDWGWTVNVEAREVFSQEDVRRRLREVEAKRRIVVEHAPLGKPEDGYGCPSCWVGEEDGYPADHPCSTLRLLALPYSDHPDYDPTWRPA